MTNDGSDKAWQNLVDRYDNNRVLVNSQLRTLFNLFATERESNPAIKRLERTTNNCISNLSLSEIQTQNWDIIFMYFCSTRLHEFTLGI